MRPSAGPMSPRRTGRRPDPLFAVEGRRIVVTGGARGIGLGAATAFLERGAAVELWDVRAEDLERARAALSPGHPGRIETECVDVSDADAVERAAARRRPRGRSHVLVNSAGISSHRRPAIEIAQADWDRMLAVNLTGPWNTCRALGRAMLARGAGSVINVASTNSVDPSPGIAHYCVSKAGVAMLTKALALEWARPRRPRQRGRPRPIQTPMTLPILEADPVAPRAVGGPRAARPAGRAPRTWPGCSSTWPATHPRGSPARSSTSRAAGSCERGARGAPLVTATPGRSAWGSGPTTRRPKRPGSPPSPSATASRGSGSQTSGSTGTAT